MQDYIWLKFGSLKEVCASDDAVRSALKKFRAAGAQRSLVFHSNTPAQREALCALIDAIEQVGGDIIDAWTMKPMTAEEARRYVMDYSE